MKRMIGSMVALVVLAGVAAAAVTRDDLSADARKLLPEQDEVQVVLKSGKSLTGTIVGENTTQIGLKVRRGPGVFTTRRILRTEIEKTITTGLHVLLAEALMKCELDPISSLTPQDYGRAIALFAEYERVFGKDHPHEGIKAKHAEFAQEVEYLDRGMEKIEGEWYTPLRAAIAKFELYGRQAKELAATDGFEGNADMKAEHAELVANRRATAREVPAVMRERIPFLLNQKLFDEAADEMADFVEFWVDSVAGSEGAAGAAVQQMDFSLITAMQKQIMAAYKAAGKGGDKHPQATSQQGMVYVPGGFFLMGADGAAHGANNFPYHLAYVGPYLIDKYEVSNAQYRKFVEHVKRTGDATMEHPDAPVGKGHTPAGWDKDHLASDDKPVVGVDWFDAYAYAAWVGKRLPTEAEWEKAARGTDECIYPWGEDAPETLNINWGPGRKFLATEMDRQNPPVAPPPPRGGCSCVKRTDAPPPPPTRLPGTTWAVNAQLPLLARQAVKDEMFEWDKELTGPYGTYHMAGNAAEWVSDYFAGDYYIHARLRNPTGPAEGKQRVYRGGSYRTEKKEDLTTFWRGARAPALREEGMPEIGFRCVMPLDIVRTR